MRPAIRPDLNHVGIYVQDLERMRRFYTEVLGLIVSDSGRGTTAPSDYVFLSADPTKHHQVILSTGRPPGAPSTVNQLSFKVGSLDELRAMYRWVKEAGVERLRAVCHGNAWSIYFFDPEGNQIEFYLDTPWYVAQPHTDPLDLELTNEQILQKTEEYCRKDPHFMPVEDWQARMRKALGIESS